MLFTAHKTVKRVSIVLLISMIIVAFFFNPALAHNPQSMELDYDFINQRLNVTITHNVADINSHYIESIEIYKTDVLYLKENYTSQPNTSTFTYAYDVQAQDGDVLRVTAICSISGSITQTITVNETSADEITITLTPQISSIDENEVQDFVVLTTSNDQPLDGVTLDIDVKLGAPTPYQRIAAGQYIFTYTAPDVNKDLTETIDVKAQKDGFSDGDTRLKFEVNEFENTGGNCPATLNGNIDSGEYEYIASLGGGKFKLHWRVQNDTILIALEGKTRGWVALGIEPVNRMEGADMIFGWVTTSGSVSAVDVYATGPTGPHPKDIDQGGTSDILCFGGKENGGITIIEFKRLLTTEDDKDKSIPLTRDIKFIWALGPDDDFDSKHVERGVGTINFGDGTYSEFEIPSLWLFHASLMILGFILMLTGMIIARFYKDTPWWFKSHKRIAPMGVLLAIIGLILGIIMVSMSSGEHFTIPHHFVGLLAIVFAVITPSLGVAQFKIKKNKKKIRAAHRWSGRITITLMFINILFGISLVI